MAITLESIINKTVLVGLSYFNKHGDLLQQKQLSGLVTEADAEKGIAIKLLKENATPEAQDEYFVLPASLSCWFHAPPGNYKDPDTGLAIHNPDFLVAWDVHQNQEQVEDGTHQWWEWYPRTTPPHVGGSH